jgi:hypothetical protein
MRQSVLFGMRYTVFLLAIFAKVHFRETLLEDYSAMTQILLASVQMAVMIVALLIFRACQFVVTEITDSVNYVSMPDEDATEWDADLEESLEPVPPKEPDNNPAIQQTTSPAQMKIEVVVFASADALRAYVRKIHVTALLVWGSFYSIDMSTYSTLYYFVEGLFGGWLLVMCFPNPRPFVSSSLMYGMLCLSVLVINFPAVVPRDASDIFAVCVMPVLFGAGWMLWVDTQTVLEDIKSVLVTCALLCGLVVAMSDWTELREMLASTRIVFVFLLVLEPLIKGMALSVLVLSVHTQQKKSMMLLFVTVYALATLYVGGAGLGSRPLVVCTISMTVILCLMQVAAVVLADWRSHGLEGPATVGAGPNRFDKT